jgi:hypothetical protein
MTCGKEMQCIMSTCVSMCEMQCIVSERIMRRRMQYESPWAQDCIGYVDTFIYMQDEFIYVQR